MKIIDAFTEILTDRENIYLDIEERGRICYKSEDKITDESAPKFIKFAIKKRHQTVLEMRSITLEIVDDGLGYVSLNDLKAMSPWIRVDLIDSTMNGKETYLVTGSPRAFREVCENGEIFSFDIVRKLNQKYPLLFGDLQIGHYCTNTSIKIVDVDDYKDLPEYVYHKHMCIKFIVNRAVSHELVRHRQHILQESQRYCRYADEVVFINPKAFFKEGSPEYLSWARLCGDSEQVYLSLLDKGASPQASRTVLTNSCKTEVFLDMNLARWRHFLTLRTSMAAEPSMREVTIPLLADVQKIYPDHFKENNLKVAIVGQ